MAKYELTNKQQKLLNLQGYVNIVRNGETIRVTASMVRGYSVPEDTNLRRLNAIPFKFRGVNALLSEKMGMANTARYPHPYILRGSDRDWGMPATIETSGYVNRIGFVYTDRKLDLSGSRIKLSSRERELFEAVLMKLDGFGYN